MIIRLLFLLLFAFPALADIPIYSTNMAVWTVGGTVGLRQGIATRTDEIDVTQAPYNCPVDGTSDCATAIQAAIDAATSNQVVKIPSGYFRLASDITINKHGITLRGEGTNTVLYRTNSGTRLLSVGHDYNFEAPNVLSASNLLRGATNLVTFSTNDLRIGDALVISTLNPDPSEAELFELFSANGYGRSLYQIVRIDSIVGTNVYFWPPLVWDFTNSPAYGQWSLAHVGTPMRERIGIENIRFSLTNEQMAGSPVGDIDYIAQLWSLHEHWITGCTFEWSRNYHISRVACVMGYTGSNTLDKCQTSGTSLAGLLEAYCSGQLTENNIMTGRLQPAVEWNGGMLGNALFGNFISNNILDFITHNVHPMMNLVEANSMEQFMLDGYFGSASHFTLFRNHIWSNYQPLRFKRWCTYNQVVGNVLGIGTASYAGGYDDDFPSGNGSVVVQLGLPNIGNQSYIYTNPPTSPFWPGLYLEGTEGVFLTNGVFVLNQDIGPTNQLWTNWGTYLGADLVHGTFTNLQTYQDGVFSLRFGSTFTNHYYGATNSGAKLGWSGSGTASNVTLASYIYATNGSRLYITGQQTYQTLMRTNRYTQNITGNVIYTNSAGVVVWSSAMPEQAITNSILYPSGAPSWWGTNRWPAIGPDQTPYVASLPAQDRAAGIGGGGGQVASVTNAAPRIRGIRFR